MKRPTTLVEAVLHQARLDLDLSVERDVATLRRRSENEGFSFLTITLPVLSDALERGLENGSFTCPTQFSRHGSLPRFLGGFFKRVFTLDGGLLSEPCAETIYWIRQICRFMKKLKIPCSDSRNRAAIRHFRSIEGELRRMTSQVERKDIILDKVSGIIWSQVFPEIDYHDLVCHHGPGVTADRYLPNERYRIQQWNHRSELTFPSDLHCYPNYGVAARFGIPWEGSVCEEGVRYLALRDELPVRVVFVPKTQTTPRVIAIEPSHMQYMQQSIKDYCYKALETHALTKHSIRFTHQSVNQLLAYRSSIDKRLATLDLKDASDRVHLHLVQRIFKTSGLLPYLEDARSLHAILPDESNIVLTKYASMGSALCFPVEAMVFYTLVQSAMHQLDGRRPSSRSVREYSRQIDIYGDDIIVPVEYTDVVVRYLESYALKVNVNKSFKNSHFRESCGGDFYKGTAVNPVYARTVPHDDLRHWGAEEIMSWNATADLFYLRGKWHVAQVIRTLLSRVVRRTIPRTQYLGSGLVHFSFLFTTHLRYNRSLCGWKQKRLHYDPINKKDHIDGNELACLNKWGISTHLSNQSRKFGDVHAVACLLSRLRGRGRPLLEGLDSVVSEDPNVVASGSCPATVQVLPPGLSVSRDSEYTVQPMGEEPTAPGKPDVRPVEEPTSPYSGLIPDESEMGDPLGFLTGRSEGLSFTHSTNRGRFKSKCRWVSLAG